MEKPNKENLIDITNFPDLADLDELLVATSGNDESRTSVDDGVVDIENFQKMLSATDPNSVSDK